MIRVLSLQEWVARTQYQVANVAVGNGINWTQLCGPDPNRWCLILSAANGNANVMPGPKPTATNIGIPLGSPTSFPASMIFRATDFGALCQDSWWGAGVSGSNTVCVTTISYIPPGGRAGGEGDA